MAVPQLLLLIAIDCLVLAAYRPIADELRWLGGSRISYGIAIGVIAATIVLPPLSAFVLDAPLWVTVALEFVPLVTFAIGVKTVVALTGGLRPEASAFYLFLRIYGHNQGKNGEFLDLNEAKIVADALDRLEESRSPTTTAFIEHVQYVNRAWLAGRPMAQEENDAQTAKIRELGFAMWGSEWARRDHYARRPG